MDHQDDEPDVDTIAAFTRLLEKIGPQWLSKHQVSPTQLPSLPGGPSPLETFLREHLAETKETIKAQSDLIEKMRAVLTPEQSTLLRSSDRSEKLADPGPTKNEQSEPPIEPQKKTTRKLINWL